jgi:GGDEF domain-containing protein
VDDRRAVFAAFRAALDTPGVVHRAEFRLRRVDGTDIWLGRVAALEEPFALAAAPAVRIGASVGVELAGPDDSPDDDALRRADEAMYRAKRVRGTYAVTGAP